jgi:hypothetical protein
MATSAPDQPISFCQRCGETLPPNAIACPRCGYPVAGTAGQPYPNYQSGVYPMQSAPRTNRPVIGGICLVLSGIIGIGLAIVTLLTIDSMVAQLAPSFPTLPTSEIRSIFYFIVGAWTFIGIMAILGGVMAIRRRHWGIAVLGGVFGLLTFGIFFIEGSILGLIGLVLIAMSRHEFERK